MLLTNSKAVSNNRSRLGGYLKYMALALLAVAVLGLGFWVLLPQFMPRNTNMEEIVCTAEKVVDGKFVTGEHVFEHGHNQSNEKAFNGQYACRLDGSKNSVYGMTYKLKNMVAGKKYRASVWRYSATENKGLLVVSAPDSKDFYQQTHQGLITEKGWEQLEMVFSAPQFKTVDFFKVYVYVTGEGAVFFDDLKVEMLADTEDKNGFDAEVLAIEMGKNSLDKLEKKRQTALRAGLLIAGDDDWVNAKIKGTDESKNKVSLRLKGDWLDHLKGNKWSFRIKMEDPNAWNRLITFSVQNPKTRDFLNEWLLHQFFEREDVLTPRYDFIYLKLNNKSLGVYAYEEHFEKQLPEYNLRREGPIVRFSEDGLWLARDKERRTLHTMTDAINSFDGAKVKPFKEGKTLASPNLAQQFIIAQNLMHAYKHGLKSAAEIFDLKALAKYYAIVDVMQAHHGIIWHNQRFYYNPIVAKLEPIGYDGFSGDKSWVSRAYYGYGAFNPAHKDLTIMQTLFSDTAFIEQYVFYLYHYSKPSYMQQLFTDLKDDLSARQFFIQEEFGDYTFDAGRFIQNAKKIQLVMQPLNNESVQAYTQKSEEAIKILKVVNYHNLPLKIVGFGREKGMVSDSLGIDQQVLLYAHKDRQLPLFVDVAAPADAKVLFYQLPSINDTMYYSDITAWPMPEAITPAINLFEEVVLKSNSVYSVQGNTVLFKTGQHVISKDIVIPANYRVNFEAGTQLNFIEKAKFLSRSPVFMHGTADAVIRITSSDKSANGFTVLEAPELSVLHYVQFDNMNTLNYDGWVLTGAVTFYDSDVEIRHCAFTENHCEDALNIVRSTFSIYNSTVSYTFADGFDADFCKGLVKDSQFLHTGNDAIDFSTSIITIDNCSMYKIGDKGISVGENSEVTVKSALIDGAVIGLAAKDLSTLVVYDVILKNCEKGFAAYQKKPEYGGATIVVQNYSSENVTYLHFIEPKSSLKLKGQLIE